MKKLIFLFAMVLAVSMAIAQNTSDTKQIGDQNQITVEQTGSGNLVGRVAGDPVGDPGNVVTSSSQTGDLNKADVTQTGDNNKAFFEQGVSYRWPGSYLPGDGNEITIGQTGASNLAWGYSLGNGNIVSVTQAVSSNTSGHWLWGDGNHATLSQIAGTGNYSYAAANSSNNSSTIGQVGTDNEGLTSQGWIGYAGHDGNNAQISQVGDRNKAVLDYAAWGSPVVGGFTSDLDGYGIQQYGASNNGTVSQVGDDNTAGLWQFGDGNGGMIIQQLYGNTANVIQEEGGNTTTVIQVGFPVGGNVVNLHQTDGAYAEVTQVGDGNVVKGLGSDPVATSFDGSILDVTQTGITNILNLQQDNGASATVMQNGLSNISTVIQN